MNKNDKLASGVDTENTEAKIINNEVANNAATAEEVKAMLAVRKDGTIRQTIGNCKIALMNDPLLKGIIRKNELSGRADITGDTKWKRNEIALDDLDINYIMLHMEQEYDIYSEKNIKRAISIVANDNSYHPIRDKLNSLVWDGTERLADLLPRYLGAEKNEYTYEATRILFMGAISRVFHPGCKFEYMVCLVGGQGAGKSSFLRLLAMDNRWFSDDIKKLDDKVFEKIDGHWICEMAEMLATGNAKSVEEIKQFISKQLDTYRRPYNVYPSDVPRQSILVGTSNNPYFLPFDRSGNRRFIPLSVDKDKAVHHPLDDDEETLTYIEQCWAEAMVMYRNGNNKLVFNEALSEVLVEMQKKFMPEDFALTMIQTYLEEIDSDFICSKELYKYALGRGDSNASRGELIEINRIMRENFEGNDWERTEVTHRTKEFRGQKGWIRIKKEEDFNPIEDDADVPFEQLELDAIVDEEAKENASKE